MLGSDSGISRWLHLQERYRLQPGSSVSRELTLLSHCLHCLHCLQFLLPAAAPLALWAVFLGLVVRVCVLGVVGCWLSALFSTHWITVKPSTPGAG